MKKLASLCLVLCFVATNVFSQSFTPGNLVVLRVGDGSTALGSGSHPVFLDEYSTINGQLVQTKALPTVANGNNRALTLGGTATSEGALTLSQDRMFLTLAGYDTTTGVASVSGTNTNRIAAVVSATGTINTQTGIVAGSAYKASSIRGAVTDGTGVWFAGAGSSSTGGTYYVPLNSLTSSPVKISSAPTNTRVVNIFNDQLYISSASSTFYGVSEVGAGKPIISGQTTTLLDSVTSGSPYGFALFDVNSAEAGSDLAYVADDQGGIYKFSKVNGKWLNNGKTANTTFRGLTLLNVCGTIKGFTATQDSVYMFQDAAGYNQALNATLTPVLGKQTNTVFRGISFTPGTLDPLPIIASLGNSAPALCFGDTSGSATITTTGGTGTKTYTWNDGKLGASRTNLSNGVYSVTVTDQAGCSAVVTNISITQPTQLAANVAKLNVSCFGGNDGGLAVGGSGGTPSYQYNWNVGNGTNLAAGVYSVTVSDANNCTVVKTDTVKQPALLVLNSTKGNVTCGSNNNGFITLSATGGNGGNGFVWNDNDVSSSRTNLTAGNYSVTVTDSKGCTAERKDTITQTASLNVSGTADSVSCYGGTNGSINVSATGGSGSFNYTWSGNLSGANPSNLQVGNYTVTVDDGNGCTGTNSFTVSQPDSISLSGTISNANCYGGDGSVVLTASGGTGALTIAWQNNFNPANLAAGTYTVTVSDANNCSAAATYTVTEPDSLSLNAQVTNVTTVNGSDGAITLTVSGGTPNYDFDWGNNVITKDRSSLTAGSYTVTVTDDKGCTAERTYTVSQPTAIDKIDEIVWVKNAGTNGSDLLFEINLAQAADLSISSFTMNGKKVAQQFVKNISNEIIAVSTQTLASGIYFIQFQAAEKTATVKVSVSK